MGLTKRQIAARKAAETRRRNLRKQGKPKAKSRSGSEAARKAWATRRKRIAVGFYKDEKDKTRPITKSTAELKRKKVIKKPKGFKGVSPKGAINVSRIARKALKLLRENRKMDYTTAIEKATPKRLVPLPSQVFGDVRREMAALAPKMTKRLGYFAKESKIKKGELKEHGYDPKASVFKRHAALNRSIKEDGFEKTRRQIQWLVNVAKDGTKLDKIYKEDLAWLKEKKPKGKADQLKMIMERVKGKKPRKLSKREVPARDLQPKAKKRTLGAKSCTHTKEIHAQGIGEIKPINPKVFRLPPKKTWTRRSKSNPNKKYTIRLNQDNSLSCNCPGWIFSKG